MMEKLLNCGLFRQIAVTHLQSARSASLESLKELLEEKDTGVCAYTLHENADAALTALLQQKAEKDRIYVAGSLYLVGEIKESLDHD